MSIHITHSCQRTTFRLDDRRLRFKNSNRTFNISSLRPKGLFGKKGRSGNHSVVKWFDRRKRLLVTVNHWLPGQQKEKKNLTQVLPECPSNRAPATTPAILPFLRSHYFCNFGFSYPSGSHLTAIQATTSPSTNNFLSTAYQYFAHTFAYNSANR